MAEPRDRGLILLTGATGYVGGRLLRALEAAGKPVRCLARRPEFLRSRAAASTQIVQGDALNAESLKLAMQGISSAYYLLHAMAAEGDFESEERRAASLFGAAAHEAGVQRVIYLGGLGEGQLSPHLASRRETGRILRASGVTTIEFRASIVIGSGSLSFEMVRALVERLPVMITPRWVGVRSQPIAIEDLIHYLLAALEIEVSQGEVFEIGGAEPVSYLDLMKEYARQRGLHRVMIPVPVLSPWLSGLWLGLVTPVYARVGRRLVDSLRNETIVRDDRAAVFFSIRPRGIREAIARAMVNEDADFAATRWSDAVSSGGQLETRGGGKAGTRRIDSR